MTSWTCTVPGRPTTKGNHLRRFKLGNGRTLSVQSKQAIRAENDARSVIAAHAPPAPLEGPLVCDVTFVFAIPQTERKRKVPRIAPGDLCMRRVDRGNLLKLIEDAMNGLVYVDDHQIVGGAVAKVWGLTDCTIVAVRTVDEQKGAA